LVNTVTVEKAAAALGALRVLMPGVDHGLIIEQSEMLAIYVYKFIMIINHPEREGKRDITE